MDEILVPLTVVTTCNTSDTELLANLEASKDRGGPFLGNPEQARTRPLVLVGSGPSALKYLKVVPGEFDIMAMNGSYKALLAAGYRPKYFAMLDAREENTNFLGKTIPDTTFYLASQCHPACFEALKGCDVVTFHMNVPTAREVFKDEAVFLGGSGGTVGMTALALAGMLGYRHLILVGYDSSLAADGASHIVYQPQNAKQQLLQVWIDDRVYWTTPTMAEQVQEFYPWNAALYAAFPGLAIDVIGEGLFYDYIATNAACPERTRDMEAAKYTEMYKHDGYRMPAHRRAAMRDLLDTFRGESLLDVGTGRGETLAEALDCGYKEVNGTETVDALLQPRVVKALLPNLPFESKSFDTVTCIEVLEHLLAEDVVPAIRELGRIARKYLIVSVCTRDAYHGGVNLHPSACPKEEWEARLREALPEAKIDEVANFSITNVSPVYKIEV